MSQGKTSNMSISEVKSTCYGLESSPSCHASSSPVAGKGHTVSQPKHRDGGKTHAGSRGTRETGSKLRGAHTKRGH